jgi:hypothetical protein
MKTYQALPSQLVEKLPRVKSFGNYIAQKGGDKRKNNLPIGNGEGWGHDARSSCQAVHD